jgi:selenide,water dikinase
MAQVLRHLPATRHPNLLIGPEHYSDAGVYKLRDDLAIVLTTEFFPPLVDDPFTFGQIAAANSLSDCYAMGATPVACLNIVGFPDKDLPIEILNAILAGGANKVAEAGAVIVGGHSVRDAEVKYGLAVTGVVHPDRFLTNRGAQAGDRLILTKPIGSGTMCSAAKAGKISPEAFNETIAIMIQLNAAAGEVAKAVGAHGVTDVTGFGLIGHAAEMADASGVTIEIRAGAVPLIDRALELAAAGVVTRTWKTTLDNIGTGFHNDGADEVLVRVLADAQTSGGQLMSVPQTRVSEALDRLHKAGLARCVEIGEVTARGAAAVVTHP